MCSLSNSPNPSAGRYRTSLLVAVLSQCVSRERSWPWTGGVGRGRPRPASTASRGRWAHVPFRRLPYFFLWRRVARWPRCWAPRLARGRILAAVAGFRSWNAGHLAFRRNPARSRMGKIRSKLMDSGPTEIAVTGLSAALPSSEIATSLRGRAWQVTIHPFSFEEALRHQGRVMMTGIAPPEGGTTHVGVASLSK